MKTTEVKFEQIYNFRDMGGQQTEDGRTVKRGLLFRCGELGHATEQDMKTLEALSLKVIVDYRDELEAASNVSPTLENVMYLQVPAMGKSNAMNPANIQQLLNGDFKLDPSMMGALYRTMVFDNPAYQALMKEFRSFNVPLLHHCSAGKDRTGIGAALIYLLLGVPQEKIIEEYLLTNQSQEMKPPKWFLELEEQMKEHAEIFKALSGVRAEYIQTVFHTISEKYDSLDDFFENEFDITPSERKALQNFYLE